jgi:hypothetical protein
MVTQGRGPFENQLRRQWILNFKGLNMHIMIDEVKRDIRKLKTSLGQSISDA